MKGCQKKIYLEHHWVGEGEGGLSKHEREKIKIIIGPHLHKLCTPLWIVLESATAWAQKPHTAGVTFSGRV